MKNNDRQGRNFQRKEELHRINDRIRSERCRVVNVSEYSEEIDELAEYKDGDEVSVRKALGWADELETDLVEISFNERDGISICKLIEYSKFLYQQKKKEKERRKNSSSAEMKEVRMTPNIDEGDLNTKIRQTRKFLEDGSKVKMSMFFKGRMIEHTDIGQVKLLRIAEELSDVGRIEAMPVLMGKRMYMSIIPKR